MAPWHLQSQGCASPMTTGTAWPAAHWTAASPCASWCLPHPLCFMCYEATRVASPTSPGPSPMTSSCPPPSMPPCVSGPPRTAAASVRSLTLMALNCCAAPSSPSTTTSLWSGSRTPAHQGRACWVWRAVLGYQSIRFNTPKSYHSSPVVRLKGKQINKKHSSRSGMALLSLVDFWAGLGWGHGPGIPLAPSTTVLRFSVYRGCC